MTTKEVKPRRFVRKERHMDWNIEPWAGFAFNRQPGPKDFWALRTTLRLTQAKCAMLLGVHRPTLQAWEGGQARVPPMAYHLLRLLLESHHFTLRHEAWNGWQVARNGKLYAPGGAHCFEAHELGAWWIKSQQIRHLEKELATAREALAVAQSENTELRTLFVNQGVVDEISQMQTRLSDLVTRLNTAKVIPLPVPAKKVAAG